MTLPDRFEVQYMMFPTEGGFDKGYVVVDILTGKVVRGSCRASSHAAARLAALLEKREAARMEAELMRARPPRSLVEAEISLHVFLA